MNANTLPANFTIDDVDDRLAQLAGTNDRQACITRAGLYDARARIWRELAIAASDLRHEFRQAAYECAAHDADKSAQWADRASDGRK